MQALKKQVINKPNGDISDIMNIIVLVVSNFLLLFSLFKKGNFKFTFIYFKTYKEKQRNKTKN